MLSEFVDTSNEHYGIDSWYFEAGLSASTGVPYIGLEDGKLVNNLRNEAIEDYQNWMYDLWQSDYIALGVGDYGWISEPVFTRNICGFSSIILLQTRQKYAGGLSPGKYFSRSMQQNLPKRHLYTLVKTGSKRFSICTEMCFVITSSWCGLPRSAWQ